jgi:alkylation response protein AidB-like acyl-CoA dehydrogenase
MGVHARPFTQDMLDADYQGPTFGPDFAPAASAQYFNNRKLSIFGGSNEIQKNIISKMILGL